MIYKKKEDVTFVFFFLGSARLKNNYDVHFCLISKNRG